MDHAFFSCFSVEIDADATDDLSSPDSLFCYFAVRFHDDFSIGLTLFSMGPNRYMHLKVSMATTMMVIITIFINHKP